jgi:hypothetical protein
MKAMHGGKATHDKIDAHKIAALLRGGMLPQAYVYPAHMHATRDLLRSRMQLAHKRAELLAHVQQTKAGGSTQSMISTASPGAMMVSRIAASAHGPGPPRANARARQAPRAARRI